MSADKQRSGLPCHQLEAVWPPSQQLWPGGRLATCALREKKRFLRALRAAESHARECFRHARWSLESGILHVACPQCHLRAVSHKPGTLSRWYCMPQKTRIDRERQRARNQPSPGVITSYKHGCNLRFNDLDGTPLAGFPHVPMWEVLLLLAYSGHNVVSPLALSQAVSEAVKALKADHTLASRRLSTRLTIYACAFVGQVLRKGFAHQCNQRVLQAIEAAKTRAVAWQIARRIERDAQLAHLQRHYDRLRERLLEEERAAIDLVKRRL